MYDGDGRRPAAHDTRQARQAARQRPGKYRRLQADDQYRAVWGMQNHAYPVRACLYSLAERQDECACPGASGTGKQFDYDLPGWRRRDSD